MEEIIKKAIEGGYSITNEVSCYPYHLKIKVFEASYKNNKADFDRRVVLDPLFWKALGKSCVWDYDRKVKMTVPKRYGYRYGKKVEYKETERERIYKISNSKKYALRFHEINLREGWEKAVEYLTGIIQFK